ncbi:MAG: glycosyltransferase [Phenylobacterium sp.]|uniref:glycosyltransferase n=1 Tax=Phenylobacterium sp. TaxID=1871053 RepID=UPI00391B5EAC
MSAATTVDVCICTFRRPSVVAAIASVAAQDLPPGVAVRLVVVDNDETPSARDTVIEAGRVHGLPMLYVHAPARNISIARNAALAAADAPYLAFLDDDETADPAWLSRLLACGADQGADVVFGAVRAVYGADLPTWVARADLHTTPSPVRRDGAIVTGPAGNVLIRREVLGDLAFDLDLGRTGGEDTVFFHELGRRGARFAYCPEALALEPVPEGRARLDWLLKRAFRSGQTHARLLIGQGANRPLNLVLAVAKAAICTADAGFHAFSPAGWRRRLVRAALHAGASVRLAGFQDIRLY